MKASHTRHINASNSSLEELLKTEKSNFLRQALRQSISLYQGDSEKKLEKLKTWSNKLADISNKSNIELQLKDSLNQFVETEISK